MSSYIIIQVGRVSKDKINGRWETTDTRRAVTFIGKEIRTYWTNSEHSTLNEVTTLYETKDGQHVITLEMSVDNYDARGSRVTFHHAYVVDEKELRPGGRWGYVGPSLLPMPLDDFLAALASNETRWTQWV